MANPMNCLLLVLVLCFLICNLEAGTVASGGRSSAPQTAANNITLDSCSRALRSGISNYPRDCSDLFYWGHRCTGVYLICPEFYPTAFEVFCEFGRDHAWTYIMTRFDGSLNFNRTWNSYKEGFGEISGEHWLGNEKIHALTNFRPMYLRVVQKRFGSIHEFYLNYRSFRVNSEESYYALDLALFDGDGSETFTRLSGHAFSTPDKDNDNDDDVNCASQASGGFWYNENCANIYASDNPFVTPTSLRRIHCRDQICMKWRHTVPLSQTAMKIRPLV